MKSLLAPELCGIWLLSIGPAMADAPTLASALGMTKTVDNCHVGTYRLTDSRVIDIAPDDDKTLDWRALNGEMGELHSGKDGLWTGTYGWTNKPDGKTASFTACDKGGIVFGNVKGQRIPFDVTNTAFQSNDVKLVGKLIMPAGSGKVPVVVLVHGAEADSEIDTNALQRIFPAQGLAPSYSTSVVPDAPPASIRKITMCSRAMS